MPILLGHDEATGYVFTGLVVLLGSDLAETALVAGLATELSRTVAQLEQHCPPRSELATAARWPPFRA